ncbi:MAG: hypothetical protein GTN60_10685 [Pseudomonas stutzeri]|jgi:hypothetical protein|uniref:hypothetical protein n=1 Tax=Stutzerimonas stutzeri TaxID=316 RepID=UPI0015E299FD|nr:hypothetical protein [Stutzerimonas stutzeri]NIM31773.1 hypothetical protein [Stutzerimonas stutzeri]NIP01129.1 hypothetical protein [Stutzerimonas stutzeri]NIQ23737.1 hypothetical protein [Stutzerimonas stutzeri]
MSRILFILLLAISCSTFAGAPPPGAKIGFGRETFNQEEVVFLIGAIVIFAVILFFMGSAWGNQDENERNDRR